MWSTHINPSFEAHSQNEETLRIEWEDFHRFFEVFVVVVEREVRIVQLKERFHKFVRAKFVIRMSADVKCSNCKLYVHKYKDFNILKCLEVFAVIYQLHQKPELKCFIKEFLMHSYVTPINF